MDVPAFHEGFSDLVALFLHFTYADVVEQAIRDSGGSITHGSLLTDIAREFGYADCGPGAPTRCDSGCADVAGLAAFDSDVLPGKEGGPRVDHRKSSRTRWGRARSAVFEAFTTIVRRKTERFDPDSLGLNREALDRVPLNEALVKAIAQEACDVAGQFLNICIRAIDYCPPADMELGEYLRALITADGDIERTDKWGFREALMRSFRRRHIFPDHVLHDRGRRPLGQLLADSMHVKGLAFRDLEFEGDPGGSRRAPTSLCARRTRSGSS